MLRANQLTFFDYACVLFVHDLALGDNFVNLLLAKSFENDDCFTL